MGLTGRKEGGKRLWCAEEGWLVSTHPPKLCSLVYAVCVLEMRTRDVLSLFGQHSESSRQKS